METISPLVPSIESQEPMVSTPFFTYSFIYSPLRVFFHQQPPDCNHQVRVCLSICMFPCKLCMTIGCTCNLYKYCGRWLNLSIFFPIEQKSLAFLPFSPFASLGKSNLAQTVENKLDKASAFNSKRLRKEFQYSLWSPSPWVAEAQGTEAELRTK